MEELSRRSILRQFPLQSARHILVGGCPPPMGQTLQMSGQQPLLCQWARAWLYGFYALERHTITVTYIKLTPLQVLNLLVLVRVENTTYSLLGYPSPINITSNPTNTEVTPTKTQLTAIAGGVQFTLTFLNPIEVRTQGRTYTIIQYSHFGYSLAIGSSNQSRFHTCR